MLPDVHQTTGEPVVTMNDMKITWEVGNHGGSFFFPSLSLVLHWARTLTNLFADHYFFFSTATKEECLFINQRKIDTILFIVIPKSNFRETGVCP